MRHMPHRPRQRRGIATVEFVMGLPVLLLLIGLTVSTGKLGFGRMRVAVDARTAAWHERQGQSTGRPLFFDASEQPLEVRKSSQVSTLFPHVGGKQVEVRSRVAIMTGSWDYRSVNPGETKDLLQKMSASGSLGQLRGFLGSLDSISSLGSLDDIASSVTSQAQDALAKGKKELNDARAKVQQELEKVKAQLKQANGQLAAAQQELAKRKKAADDTRNELTKLNADRKKADGLTDKKKREEELNRIDKAITDDNAKLTRENQDVDKQQSTVDDLRRKANALNEADRRSANALPK